MSENLIVKACQDILNAYGILNWRNNTGATQIGNRYIKFGEPGSPDIIAVYGGQFLGIECKIPGGKQSKSQIEFQKNLEDANGIYLLIDNPDDLISYLDKNNFERSKVN